MIRIVPGYCVLLLTLCLPSASATDFHVYYLGGQSNMDGYGYVRDLPDQTAEKLAAVPIFHGNPAADATPVDGKGVWSALQPGHGAGFSTDGRANQYSDRFGVELTLARRLMKKFPQRRIAFIKYSRGGTSIEIDAAGPFGCWDPDFTEGAGAGQSVNQYDHFLATIRNATQVDDIDGDGQRDRLIPAGIVWMQGESDAAYTREIAERYEANLKRLMDLIRAALRADDLPVVIGRISDSGQDEKDGRQWDHGDIVRSAQASFCQKDESAALVTSTDEYSYSDPWHYDSAGYIDLGQEFADALAALEE